MNEKVEIVPVDEFQINKTIENEFAVGWKVKQIIYAENVQKVLILFERIK